MRKTIGCAPLNYFGYVTGATHTHFANICDIAETLISIGIPPEDWPTALGGAIAPLIGPYSVTCARYVYPLDSAQRIQNTYAVSFFRRTLLSDTDYEIYLTQAWAADNEPELEFVFPRPVPAVDHVMTYKTKGSSLTRFGPMELSDRWRTAGYDVLRTTEVGPSAEVGWAGQLGDTLLQQYRLRPTAGTPAFSKIVDLDVANTCGNLVVKLKKPASILAPANDDGAPFSPGDGRDHYLCYKAGVQRARTDGTPAAKLPRGLQLTVEEAFETRRFDLRKLTKVCFPTTVGEVVGSPPVTLKFGTPRPIQPDGVDHPNAALACYRAKLATRNIPQRGCGCDTQLDPSCSGVPFDPPQLVHEPIPSLTLETHFGYEVRQTRKEREICLRSTVP